MIFGSFDHDLTQLTLHSGLKNPIIQKKILWEKISQIFS